ncbi:UNVERIFIED_CONTAM: hypothetical protein GTU68_018112 [Idotea baltica]|nr:hypothetical protein [Idotea baltica]
MEAASTFVPSCGARTTRSRCCCSPPETRCRTKLPGSMAGQTTTSPSRLMCQSSRPGFAPCFVAQPTHSLRCWRWATSASIPLPVECGEVRLGCR